MSRRIYYIMLRPPLEVAIERCRARGGDTLTDPAAIGALHEQVSALGEREKYVVDTSGQVPEDTLEAVGSALASRSFRLGA